MTGQVAYRLALVPGVNPDRWLRVWQQRLPDVPVELVHTSPGEAVTLLRSGAADVALVRLPAVGDDLSTISLYTETTVVLVPKDHVVTVVEEIDAADLDDETVLVALDDQLHWTDPPGTPFAGDPIPTTADAVDLVAAGIGVLVLPQSLGRLHQRRGLTTRTVRDAPGSAVGLAWMTDRYDDLTEEFIGIVRGRTATSSRGRGAPASAEPTGRGRRPGGSGTTSTGKGAPAGTSMSTGKSTSAGKSATAGKSAAAGKATSAGKGTSGAGGSVKGASGKGSSKGGSGRSSTRSSSRKPNPRTPRR